MSDEMKKAKNSSIVNVNLANAKTEINLMLIANGLWYAKKEKYGVFYTKEYANGVINGLVSGLSSNLGYRGTVELFLENNLTADLNPEAFPEVWRSDFFPNM